MGLEDASQTVHDLISKLRSSFFVNEFQHVADTLAAREEEMKNKCIELQKKAEASEKEAEASEKEKDLLLSKLSDDLEKKQKEIDALRKENLKNKDTIKFFKNLTDRVSKLEETSKELMDSDETSRINLENKQQKKNCAAGESSRPSLSDKKGDSGIKSKSKFQEVIQIDDPGIKSESKFQKVIQIDDDKDDDDNLRISTLKRKRVSNEIERECNVDHVDNIPSGTQKGKNLHKPHNQLVSTTHSGGKTPCLKTQKERWVNDDDMLKEFDKDDELCMSAICALYRQRIQGHEWAPLGPYLAPAHDISRIHQLTNLLTDWDPQQKPKKKAPELEDIVLNDCRRFARKYSSQLFNIYKDKDDPFFPPSVEESLRGHPIKLE